jgi:glutamine synthetase
MKDSSKEVLTFVRENDVKFIRLAFCDNVGQQKNISLQPGELERAFESGIPFNASSLRGFHLPAGTKLLLRPDARTLSVLPWRPSSGRVIRLFCDLLNADGTPYGGDTRAMLQQAVQEAAEMGYTIRIGSACEFYLFNTDENGDPTHVPQDRGTFFDLAPADRGENVRRDICLTLYEMGIIPESSHHAVGPGQNEVVFRSSDALSAADNFLTFKSVVKQSASVNGLYASFMPKPMEHEKSSGLALMFEIYKGDKNVFEEKTLEPEACSFVAGILERLPELTAFLKPTTNSYSADSCREPGWSNLSDEFAFCIPAISGIKGRAELSAADPAINPHLAYALLIRAGLEGIRAEKTLPRMETACGKLPHTLRQALTAATHSDFVKENVPQEVRCGYLGSRQELVADYAKAKKRVDYDLQTYFELL